jgi:hypothetical protein
MVQDEEIIKTGRLATRDGRTVLLCDGLVAWNLFLERDASAYLGQKVTICAHRFGFGMLHVTSIAPGVTVPPPARESRLLIGSVVVAQGLGLLALLWSIGQPVRIFATDYLP